MSEEPDVDKTEANSNLLLPRLGTPRDYSYETFGPQVVEVAKAVGFKLFPWQIHILNVALEYRMGTDGLPDFHYREIRLWVPRQSGKTTLTMALLAWRCLMGPEVFGKPQNVRFYSTTGLHAKKKWGDEHVPYLEDSLLNGQFEVRRSPGLEGFLWNNKSSWTIGASTEKAGHGDTLDLVVADEFFAQSDDRIEEGARPTMITRRSPQIWFISTFGSAETESGKPEKANMSEPLWKKVDDGRERCRTGEHGSVCSMEYSATDFDDYETGAIDYGSHELWLRTMPSLAENGGLPSYNLATVQAEFESMNLGAFKRSYLNLRAPRGQRRSPALIAPKQWDAVTDERSNFRRKEKLWLGFDIERDNARASIVAAGPNVLNRDLETKQPIHTHVELVADEEGSEWIPDELSRLIVRHDIAGISLDTGGPAARLLPDIERIVSRNRVELVKYTGKAYQAACEAFRVAVVDATMRNNGQQTLADAVDQGLQRMTSDLWVWDRKSPLSYISALVAATVAHRAAQEAAAGGSRISAYEDESATVWVG